MGVPQTTKQAYSEIDEFLNLLPKEQREKIPKKLREFFKEEKDADYIKEIKVEIPIREQNLKEETLAIIALLNLQYWCQDEKEKEQLKNIYANNEKQYQEMLREKYNPDNLFKNRNQSIDETKVTNLIEYKESIFRKIINKIKKIFDKH